MYMTGFGVAWSVGFKLSTAALNSDRTSFECTAWGSRAVWPRRRQSGWRGQYGPASRVAVYCRKPVWEAANPRDQPERSDSSSTQGTSRSRQIMRRIRDVCTETGLGLWLYNPQPVSDYKVLFCNKISFF